MSEAKFVDHLLQFRSRIINCLVAVTLIFCSLIYFANDIYSYLALPLIKHLTTGQGIIATEIAATFLVPIKLTFYLSIFIAIPFVFYQLWSFIMPGLYRNERRILWSILFTSTLLFYLGLIFAYYIVCPLVFGFFTKVAPHGVSVMPDMNHYLNFVIKLLFAFGIAFEVPIIVTTLIATGICTEKSLTEKRPYVIVAAFVLGMFLTPPDVISQVMLAIPLWLLFELGILFSRLFNTK